MAEEVEPSLQPGFGFRLQPNGQWRTEKVPSDVVESAVFSGYLTIMGYRCTVFETPDWSQWAQKSVATAAPPEEVRAAFFMSSGRMTPKAVASALRSIASRIDRSRAPDRGRVAADIRAALRSVASGADFRFDVPGMNRDFMKDINDEGDPDALGERLNNAKVDFCTVALDHGVKVIGGDPDGWDLTETEPGGANNLLTACQDAAGERPDDDLDFLMGICSVGTISPAQ
jgi:hypothetical protein